MGEMCINFSEVKPGLRPALKALNKDEDDETLCRKEVPDLNDKDFKAFVNMVRIDPLIEIERASSVNINIKKSQLECLQKLASKSNRSSEYILDNAIIEDGYITTLDLRFEKEISDISDMKGLTRLRKLTLRGTKVSDLIPLKGLINLQELNLEETKVSDLSPLKGLINLQKLYLKETKVSNLSPLKGLINLQELYLEWNSGIKDISPLQGLTKLRTLNLYYTPVSHKQVESLEKELPGLEIFYRKH
ncbi:MAG: leucine-rich repeat domain-containing protein [Candidatus Margulisiibacteriota bacterium]